MLGTSDLVPTSLYIHHHGVAGHQRLPPVKHHQLRLCRQGDGSWGLDTPLAHRYLIMTTIESYLQQVAHCFRNVNCATTQKAARYIDFPADHDGIGWARVVRDEAHLVLGFTTLFFQIMQSFVLRASRGIYKAPNFLALTATPILRNGIGDMMSLVRTINDISPDIDEHAQYADFIDLAKLEGLRDCQLEMRKAQQTGGAVTKAQEQAIADAIGRLQLSYTIRRRNSSVQNNKALAVLPEIVYKDVQCPNSDDIAVLQMRRVEWLLKKQLTREFKTKKALWRATYGRRPMEEIELDLFLDNAQAPRILSTIPWLTELKFRYYFTWQHIMDKEWHTHPDLSPFAANIAEVERTSGKLCELRKILTGLRTDVQGRPEKLVVVSEFPVVCLAVLVVCELPQLHVLFRLT